jgi:hypothetical protein
VGGCRLDSSGSGHVLLAITCGHGSEPSGSIKDREFLDQLSNYQLLKKESATWSYSVS